MTPWQNGTSQQPEMLLPNNSLQELKYTAAKYCDNGLTEGNLPVYFSLFQNSVLEVPLGPEEFCAEM